MRGLPPPGLWAVAVVAVSIAGCGPHPKPNDIESVPPRVSNQEETPPMRVLEMQEFAGSHRPVLLFADEPQNLSLIEQQRRLVGHEPGLAERSMPVVTVAGNAVTLDGEAVEADAPALRRRYDVPEGVTFRVLLVGKDTGVKLSEEQPVEVAELFALVDSMPMRQREMRSRSGS